MIFPDYLFYYIFRRFVRFVSTTLKDCEIKLKFMNFLLIFIFKNFPLSFIANFLFSILLFFRYINNFGDYIPSQNSIKLASSLGGRSKICPIYVEHNN